jgi:hypothetical protein
MKPTLSKLLIIILLCYVQNATAQYIHFRKKPVYPWDFVVGPCMGFGGIMDVHYFSHQTALTGFSAELILPIKMDLGYFSAGLITGCRSAENYHVYPISKFGTYYYYDRFWNWVAFSFRGAYHYDLLEVRHLDTYVGAVMSYCTVKVSYVDNLYTDPNMRGNPYPLPFKNFTKNGLMVGARYDFYKSFGVFGEASTGIMYLTLGLSYRL